MSRMPLRLGLGFVAPLMCLFATAGAWAAPAGAEAPKPQTEWEEKLVGSWIGGPCMGVLEFSKDGTFQRRHYSPGDNEISGTWKLTVTALPPTLMLTATRSDDPNGFPPGQVWDLKLVKLDGEKLTYQTPGSEGSSTYRRQTLDEEAKDLMQGRVIHATLTQSIGSFSSYGIPKVGDTFTLDPANLPKDMLKMKTPGADERPSYIPLSSQPKVVSVKQGPRGDRPRRTVIDLATPDAGREVRIRIMADGTDVGSKVRLQIYRSGDFLGSMAEAEGTLK